MLEHARLPALVLFSACALLCATAAFPATPEEFVKGKEAPAAAAPAPAANAAKSSRAGKPNPPPPMDTVKIHEQYLEGDFDHAIRALEAQLKSQRPMSHAESVFVYKHLGVMYAAQQSTRERGKHYMQALIAIEPTAKILDMYASDMIHLIFRNVQEEFEAKQRRLVPAQDSTAVAAAPVPSPAPTPAPASPAAASGKGSGARKTLFLAAAGTGVAVGALALFFLLGEEAEPKVRTIEVRE